MKKERTVGKLTYEIGESVRLQNIKTKKWATLCESNVALRKAAVCTINDRYILKMGGLSEK